MEFLRRVTPNGWDENERLFALIQILEQIAKSPQRPTTK